MRPEFLALTAAVLWAVGAFYGKRGMAAAGLEPQLGLLVRLGVSAIAVLAYAAPRLARLGAVLSDAGGRRGVWTVGLFEGLLAGTLGMLAFYFALREGEVSRVVPLAFTTPLWGFLLGVGLGGESLTWAKALGALAIVGGVALLNLR